MRDTKQRKRIMEELDYIKDIIENVSLCPLAPDHQCEPLERMEVDYEYCKKCPVNLIVWAFKRGMGYEKQAKKTDLALVLAGIENAERLLNDYRHAVEHYDNYKPLSVILETLAKDDYDFTGGYDVTNDGSSRRCYTFEKDADGQARYLGLWKC